MIKKAVDFLLFSNLFISLCAVAQGWLTYLLLGTRADVAVLSLLFFATLFIYNTQAVLNKIPRGGTSIYYHADWLIRHRILIRVLSVVAGTGMFALFFALTPVAKTVAVITGVLAIGYSYPFFRPGGLRQIPGLKLFLISAVWASACVLVPYFQSGVKVSTEQLIFLWLKRFLFIAAITLPFDIRDILPDRRTGLKTLANMLGKKKAVALSLLFLGLYSVLLFLFGLPDASAYVGLVATVLIAAVLITKSTVRRPTHFYLLLLDGILILQPVFVLLGLVITD